MRQTRNYAPVNETHRQVEEQLKSPTAAESRPTRNYDALRETQHQVDDDRQNGETEKERQTPESTPSPLRSWTHHGGMVWQQGSANQWVRQNHEIRMAQSERTERTGQETQPGRDQNDPALQRARHIAEQARQRESAERSRERERSGPER